MGASETRRSRNGRLRELFQDVVDLSPDARARRLEQECGSDLELRQEVERLVAADHEAPPEFLASIVTSRARSPVRDRFVGRRLGPYRLTQKLGEGGAGVVYQGVRDDAEYYRRVAVKLLRLELATAAIRDRFLTERQILAALDHPQIARLLDGGTTEEGLPYLVMEQIEGRPIDRFCEGKRLGVRARVELFLRVCDAVQYAHRNLVVHRDLKPSNILVREDGEPKLLDFGIAKLLNPELAGAPREPTRVDGGMMTPEYASPEQVRGEPITTASDVYSLGVVLYKLLTGCHPYPLRSASLVEVGRLVCEHEPTRPSLRVREHDRESEPGEDAGSPSVPRRGVGAGRLDRDLDTIVDKAMRKQAEHRYPSVDQLAEDLRRYLAGLPVKARQATSLYRLGKFVRRNRTTVALASAALGLLLAFAVAMAVQSVRISRERDRTALERDRANREAEVAREVSDFLVGLFEVSDPAQARGAITARELLDEGADRLTLGELEDAGIRLRMVATVGRIYANLGLYEESATLLDRAIGEAEGLTGADRALLADLHRERGSLYRLTGSYDRAEEQIEKAIEVRREAVGPKDAELGHDLIALAGVFFFRGEFHRAETLCEQGQEILEAAGDPKASDVLENLALLQTNQGRFSEAERLYLQLLSATPRSASSGLVLARRSNNFGVLLHERGKLDEAEVQYTRAVELYEEVFPDSHQRKALSMSNLAEVYVDQNRYLEAEEIAKRARTGFVESVGEEHRSTALNLSLLSEISHRLGMTAEAEAIGKRALALQQRLLGPDHPHVALTLRRLANLHQDQGRWDEADAEVLEALAIRRKTLGEDHPFVALSFHDLAVLRRGQGRLEEAIVAEEEALARGEAAYRPDHPSLVEIRDHLDELRRQLAGTGLSE